MGAVDTGDAVPSAVYDPSGYLYVFYENRGAGQLAQIWAARAPSSDFTSMMKFTGLDGSGNGTWTVAGNGVGVTGAVPVLPTDAPGSTTDCNSGMTGAIHPNVTYNLFLKEYLMVLLCRNSSTAFQWYFSTTADLADESWSTPVPIPSSTSTAGQGNFYTSVFDTSTNTSDHGTGFVLFGCCFITSKNLYTRTFVINAS